jgi:hypothetical protein
MSAGKMILNPEEEVRANLVQVGQGQEDLVPVVQYRDQEGVVEEDPKVEDLGLQDPNYQSPILHPSKNILLYGEKLIVQESKLIEVMSIIYCNLHFYSVFGFALIIFLSSSWDTNVGFMLEARFGSEQKSVIYKITNCLIKGMFFSIVLIVYRALLRIDIDHRIG